MSDWVNCNKCSVRHNSQVSFFLVECGHIFCQRCVEKIKTSNKCTICNKSGQVILLNKNVEQNILDYFVPVENHFKKAFEVYKFQLQHRSTYLKNLLEKYNYLKKEYLNCQNANKHLLKENQMMRSMLISINGKQQRSQSSPYVGMRDHNVSFQNSSIVSSIRPPMQTPSEHNRSLRRFPNFSKRNKVFGSGSSSSMPRPSPVQKVPLGYGKAEVTPVLRGAGMGNTMSSLEELRRGTCHQK